MFFFLDVNAKAGHEGLDGGLEVGVIWLQTLKLVRKLFDLLSTVLGFICDSSERSGV